MAAQRNRSHILLDERHVETVPIEQAKRKKLYYILEGHGAVYVKDGAFFKSQGGLTAAWGRAWRPVRAHDIEAARALGQIKPA